MSARWPRMMKRKTAAEYCDLSESAFEGEVLKGRLPAAMRLGNRDHWDKVALDNALTRLSGGGSEPDYRRKHREQYASQAA